MASSSSSYASPCAACKYLRRRCILDCIFAPYFPPEERQKFANVHKIFGASNVTKLLNELLPHQREDAVNSLAYEAEARVRDPVYGCVGVITSLQRQVQRLQYASNEISPLPASLAMPPVTQFQQIHQGNQFGARFGNEESGFCREPPNTYSFPYSLSCSDTSLEDINEGGGGSYSRPTVFS
ncbi:unnamed protein product [Lupinus luteus]|uniref:LOB domain-containing protein n=1 Tax=Lupinus luteus TaxID=3873 RepID=A0AAV1W8B8_LUPLU